MPKKKTVKIVYPDWKHSIAHIAQEIMPCTGYGPVHNIQFGDLYTRHKPSVAEFWYAQHPFCRLCIPFLEIEKTRYDLIIEYQNSDLKKKDDEYYKKILVEWATGGKDYQH